MKRFSTATKTATVSKSVPEKIALAFALRNVRLDIMTNYQNIVREQYFIQK